MDFNLSEEFPIEFKKIKKLGYETIEKRYLQPNMDTGIHSHPFVACMIILEGEISLANSHEKKLLKKGDFISVESNVSHHEKVGKKGVTVLYGKKFNENKYNLKIIEDSLDALYLGGNNNTISFITKTPLKSNPSSNIVSKTNFLFPTKTNLVIISVRRLFLRPHH